MVIKIIMMVFFNHCGSFNKWMDKRERFIQRIKIYKSGAYISKDRSVQLYILSFLKTDGLTIPVLKAGGAYDTFAKTKFMKVVKSFAIILLKLVRSGFSPPYNVDGWRLDVAARFRSQSGV